MFAHAADGTTDRVPDRGTVIGQSQRAKTMKVAGFKVALVLAE
jgi:hypothetical protein